MGNFVMFKRQHLFKYHNLRVLFHISEIGTVEGSAYGSSTKRMKQNNIAGSKLNAT
jgi:hypothetical protein